MKYPSALLTLLLALTGAALAANPAPEILMDVDAREISRSLLHARLEIPASSGEFILWYPKWVPGVHAPGGPSENIGGLHFETPAGETIAWRRDDEELNRFHLTVPAGVSRVVAKLDYICSQPSVNSSGVDSFGNPSLGVINWNTVLLYPETASIDSATATVHLQLPGKWRFGTALPVAKASGAEVWFTTDTLRHVVDSPIIFGEHCRTIDVSSKGTPPAFVDLASESASAIEIDDALIGQLHRLVAEAVALFGGARWHNYHFLVVCSDQLPRNGLEHLSSSFNEVGERDLVDAKKRKNWAAYLLPHEFVHAWCGKFRRPAGMVTTTFHQPEHTKLLWIYEGLTQYLGEVLTVRSGLTPFSDYLPNLASKLDFLNGEKGREWRSLEDTAISSWQLRAHSEAWGALRRGQDYYDEGLVIWLEADALIRERTGGKKSLDDFCRVFFAAGRDPQLAVVPYELPEVLGILHGLADEDWAKFFHDRVDQPRAELGLDFLKNLGYRLQYSPRPSERLAER